MQKWVGVRRQMFLMGALQQKQEQCAQPRLGFASNDLEPTSKPTFCPSYNPANTLFCLVSQNPLPKITATPIKVPVLLTIN